MKSWRDLAHCSASQQELCPLTLPSPLLHPRNIEATLSRWRNVRVDNLKRHLQVQWRHILRWRSGVRAGQSRSGGMLPRYLLITQSRTETVVGRLIRSTGSPPPSWLTIITYDFSDGWAQGSPPAGSCSAEEKILNKTRDRLSQWFTLILSSVFICVTGTRFRQVASKVLQETFQFMEIFSSTLSWHRSPRRADSDDTDLYLLTAGSGETTSILYMVNQCHAPS